MSNGSQSNLDQERAELEVHKLRLERAQLAFEVSKLMLLTPAEEANAQKTARDKEREKLQAEIDKLNQEEKAFRKTVRLATVPYIVSIAALLTSLLSIGLTTWSTYMQSEKLKADQRIDADNRCRDSVEKAVVEGPLNKRLVFLAALGSFWDDRNAYIVGTALTSTLLIESDPDIIWKCSDTLKHAYEKALTDKDKIKTHQVLFGTLGQDNRRPGDIGLILSALGKNPRSRLDIDDLRRTALMSVLSYNRNNLQESNFNALKFSDLDIAGAELAGSDFSNAQTKNWILADAKFNGCRLRSARFENANLTEAEFPGADLTSADFVGSDLFRANFLYALSTDKMQLAGTNLQETKGLTDQQIQQALDQGAVLMSSIDFRRWQRLSESYPTDPGVRKRWKENKFAIDQSSGQPLLENNIPAENLTKVRHP